MVWPITYKAGGGGGWPSIEHKGELCGSATPSPILQSVLQLGLLAELSLGWREKIPLENILQGDGGMLVEGQRI